MTTETVLLWFVVYCGYPTTYDVASHSQAIYERQRHSLLDAPLRALDPMALLLLIDGYNVVSPVAPPSRNTDPNWLHRERMRLVDRLVNHLDETIRSRTCVVFDAANPPRDRPSEFTIDGITIRFAIDFPEADDLIEDLIGGHHSPKQLMVVSSDHRIQAAASRRGAKSYDSQPWLDDLLSGNVHLAIEHRETARGRAEDEKPNIEMTKENINDWMKEFGFDET